MDTDNVPNVNTDKVPDENTDNVPEENTDTVPDDNTDNVPDENNLSLFQVLAPSFIAKFICESLYLPRCLDWASPD